MVFLFMLSVGRPIDLQKTENPTQEEVDELHSKFVQQLVDLFESEKHRYIKNSEKTHLELM